MSFRVMRPTSGLVGGASRPLPAAGGREASEWPRSKFCERMRAKNFGHRNRDMFAPAFRVRPTPTTRPLPRPRSRPPPRHPPRGSHHLCYGMIAKRARWGNNYPTKPFLPKEREMNLAPSILGQIFRRFSEKSAPFFVAKFVK